MCIYYLSFIPDAMLDEEGIYYIPKHVGIFCVIACGLASSSHHETNLMLQNLSSVYYIFVVCLFLIWFVMITITILIYYIFILFYILFYFLI